MFSHCHRAGRRLVSFSLRQLAKRRSLAKSIAPQPWNCTTLENRLLMAADVAACTETVAKNAAQVALPNAAFDGGVENGAAAYAVSPVAVVFVDSEVADSELLLRGIAPGADIYLIPRQTDGIAYISRILEQKQNVQTIQLISHGRSGAVRLRSADIDLACLERRAAEIARWSNSLTPTADILLLGCDVGQGIDGAKFVQTMADLSGCGVAASVDRTGHSSFGGDWELERLVAMMKPESFERSPTTPHKQSRPIEFA